MSLTTSPPHHRAVSVPERVRAHSPRRNERRRLALVAVATYLVYVGCLWRTYFFFDDFLWFYEADSMPLDLGYLRRLNYTHFAPITRCVYLAYHGLFGLDWPPAPFILAGIVVACVVGVYTLAFELGARPSFALAAAGFVAASPVMLHVSQWWGGSVHVLGGLLATLWVAIEFLRWQRTGVRRHYLWSLVALFSGLLVQERPLLVLAALGLFALYPPSAGWQRQRLARSAASVAPHLLLGAAYVVFFTSQYPTVPGERPPLGLLVRFLGRAAARNFGPVTIGLQPARLGDWATVVGVAALLFWASLAVRRFSRREVRLTLFLAVGMWLANFGILAYGRTVLFGPGITDDLQYHVDALVWFVAPTAALLGGRRTRPLTSRRRPERAFSGWQRRIPVLAAVSAVAVVAFTWSAVLDRDTWAQLGRSERRYVLEVAEGVEELRNLPDRFELVPLDNPTEVFPSWVPLDQRQLVALFSAEPVSTPGSPRKFAFDAFGRLRRVDAAYADVVEFGETNSGQVTVSGADLAYGERGACVTATDANAFFQVAVDDGGGPPPSLLEITYTAEDAYEVAFGVGNAEGQTTQSPVFEQASGTWTQLLPYESLQGAAMISYAGPPRGSTTCLHRIALVVPVAQPLEDGIGCDALGLHGEIAAATSCGGPWFGLAAGP